MNKTIYFIIMNLEAKKALLIKDYQQNINDYEYRCKYDKFKYRFINNRSKRKIYSKEFIF